jgi:hypothetical protein
MSGLIRILTSVVFAAHIILGCCSHHAHAGDCQERSFPVQGTTAPYSQCPDNHGNGGDQSQHGSHDCQGTKCSVVSARSEVGNSFVQLSQMIAAPSFQSFSSLLGIANEQNSIATVRLLSPISLHLTNQVLLI